MNFVRHASAGDVYVAESGHGSIALIVFTVTVSGRTNSISISAYGALAACWSMLIGNIRDHSIKSGLYKCPKESKCKLRAALE
jgi:hypothetical protein